MRRPQTSRNVATAALALGIALVVLRVVAAVSDVRGDAPAIQPAPDGHSPVSATQPEDAPVAPSRDTSSSPIATLPLTVSCDTTSLPSALRQPYLQAAQQAVGDW